MRGSGCCVKQTTISCIICTLMGLVMIALLHDYIMMHYIGIVCCDDSHYLLVLVYRHNRTKFFVTLKNVKFFFYK